MTPQIYLQYQEAGDGTETKPDLVVYELRKYLTLAADANPNILELLFCDDNDVIKLSPAGTKLRASRHLFLSKKARHTFSGYAMSRKLSRTVAGSFTRRQRRLVGPTSGCRNVPSFLPISLSQRRR